MEETTVVIMGAGPAGLATSACLNRLLIPNIVLEREDCYASLWKKRSYDRLKLHLAKKFCQLPYMDFPFDAPTFMPKNGFVDYLESYVSHFCITPRYLRSVESAVFESDAEKWRIGVKNMTKSNDVIVSEMYMSRFLVVATGKNSQAWIPDFDGLESYGGEFLHSSQYENGVRFGGKDVLVVGCGNSGMEIAYDLWNWGANTSIVIRNPVHVLTKEMVKTAMIMLQYLPLKVVDTIFVAISKLKYGSISKYGILRPKKGPFSTKVTYGRDPIIDVGTISKIKSGEIKVLPGIKCIRDKNILFANDETIEFDAVVFATGYKSTVGNLLNVLLQHFGLIVPLVKLTMKAMKVLMTKECPEKAFRNTGKGKMDFYNAGFSRRGLLGISIDAQNIAKDITTALGSHN